MDWIVSTLGQWGYTGIALLMFLENLFPPIPSELIMPLAGFTAARGDLSLVLVIVAGVVGSVVGALPWYYAGKLLGEVRMAALAARYGRLMTVSPGDVHNAVQWFDRHGWVAVLFGRLLPAIRTLISVPAGIARMKMLPFLIYTTVGSAFWTAFLAVSGYLLESKYELVQDYIDPISKIVVAAVVLAYLYRLITFRPAGAAVPPA